MDIIVTTPKGCAGEAAQEARDCIASGGGYYFRRFTKRYAPHCHLQVGDRIYYVERGYVRGFALLGGWVEVVRKSRGCETTGRWWLPGVYLVMDATTWQWIRPIQMRGFQGWRSAQNYFNRERVEIIGGWLDPMPAIMDTLPAVVGP
jgi:hypothetical protein